MGPQVTDKLQKGQGWKNSISALLHENAMSVEMLNEIFFMPSV